jgi:membrane glycosyltransferase
MLFHTQFVLSSLIGHAVRWRSPPREDAQTTWGDAIRRHGLHTLLGVAWAGFVWWLNPTFLWWLLPVVGALILSVPVSVYTSRVAPGRRLRRRRLFLIPEEARPPAAMRATRKYVKRALPEADGEMAVVDPLLNALACAQGVARHELPEAVRRERSERIERALRDGWSALLHMAVWSDAPIAPSWRRARDAERPHPPRPWQPAQPRIEAARPAA